mmetsp:Transcript_24459/g.53333  ORF Transcript_24459/g.53333 Transcript_24459/m.53333 type:complete len:92 (+) Transcript_24459:54-329(+)
MPLSEPMKAAIVMAIVVAVATFFVTLALANLGSVIASAMKAEEIGTYAGFGGFAGGLFEDIRRVVLATESTLKNHLPLVAGATAFALSLPS